MTTDNNAETTGRRHWTLRDRAINLLLTVPICLEVVYVSISNEVAPPHSAGDWAKDIVLGGVGGYAAFTALKQTIGAAIGYGPEPVVSFDPAEIEPDTLNSEV